MNLPVIPVVLCGGAGPRLWPLFRDSDSEQFLPLQGEKPVAADDGEGKWN